MLNDTMGAMRTWVRHHKFYAGYIAFLAFVNLLPILAPILLKLGESSIIFHNFAKLIYLIYSFTCHQFDHRSFFLFDYQYAWCARDVGIWLGILFGAIHVARAPQSRLRWFWLLPFIIPIALDGGIQTVATLFAVNPYGATGDPVYISSNLTRFLTGALFGFGLSWWLSRTLLDAATLKHSQVVENLSAKWKQIRYWLAGLLISYIIVLFAWNLTSPLHLPIDLLDSAPKHPSEEFFTRRRYAVCPTTVKDYINWECFWS
jgi:uncharacterized membrane protein